MTASEGDWSGLGTDEDEVGGTSTAVADGDWSTSSSSGGSSSTSGSSGNDNDPALGQALSIGWLLITGPSPIGIALKIVGLLGALADRGDRRERAAEELEELRTIYDQRRRRTLAWAASNVLDDVLLSSDADGIVFTQVQGDAVQAAATALMDMLHANDWVSGGSDIAVPEGWLGDMPLDVWERLQPQIQDLWNQFDYALRVGTPVNEQGAGLTPSGTVKVDAGDVFDLFLSQASQPEYVVRGHAH